MAGSRNINKAVLDYEDGLKRFSNVSALYQKHLKKFADDKTFKELVDAMHREDYKDAFYQAHTLKGVAGNLSLARLYQYLIPFTNTLRDEADVERARVMLPELEKYYQEALEEIAGADF